MARIPTPWIARWSAALVVLAGVLSADPAAAKVFYTQKQALEAAFPLADRVEKETHILSTEQVAAIESRARSKLESRLVTLYTGYAADEVLGYAHIDVHKVRTHPEGFMVVMGPSGEVRSLRILAFYEPLDYLPADRWYGQFAGKSLDERLRLGRDIHGVVGATLSARAATAGVRRALAYHEVLVVGVRP